MADYRSVGDRIPYTPPTTSAVAVGDVRVFGELVAVATQPIPENQLGSLAVSGVVEFPKATGGGSAITLGALCYWDVADGQATTDADTGTNKLIGKCVKAAADADATVLIKMDQ